MSPTANLAAIRLIDSRAESLAASKLSFDQPRTVNWKVSPSAVGACPFSRTQYLASFMRTVYRGLVPIAMTRPYGRGSASNRLFLAEPRALARVMKRDY